MKIGVLGLGYVGLTTALGFASQGQQVSGLEIDPVRHALIASRKMPFFEPDMEPILQKCMTTKNFLLAAAPQNLAKAEIVFFCVGTPSAKDDSVDLGFLQTAIRQMVEVQANTTADIIYVIKSSMPPSSLRQVIQPLVNQLTQGKRIKLHLAVNPEFLREAHSWQDFMHPDRIVIGSDDAVACQKLQELYQSFQAPIVQVSPTTAEFIKYLSNCALANLISFANEMAAAATTIGDIDIKGAFEALHLDKRWYQSGIATYCYPGCGYGGYCLPKDTLAMSAVAKKFNAAMPLLDSTVQTNQQRPAQIAQEIATKVGSLPNSTYQVGILGLAFKPGSADTRCSPALAIIKNLQKLGITKIIAFDPLAMPDFQKVADLDITYAPSAQAVVDQAAVSVILTAWPEFKALDKTKILDYRYYL
jgi:UDPglucose 6-dehydrogenase